MYEWFKQHFTLVLTVLVTVSFLFFAYSCEPHVASLYRPHKQVNRQGLQLELDQLVGLTQIRMADLDRQEQFRAIILQNALVLVQGQPFNPLGLITAIAGVYGIQQAGGKVRKVVKDTHNKRKANNGHT